MILFLAFLSFLQHPASSHITTRSSVHYSDALKIKCDALPYRTAFFEFNCYFAIDADKLNSSAVSTQCSKVLTGSKLTENAPNAVWRTLLVDKSRFLGESGGSEKAMCKFESKYRCATGSVSSIAGRCLHFGNKKMNYGQAENFCSSVGSLPSPENDRENRDVAVACSSPVWIRPSHSGNWSGRTTFSRFSSCAQAPFYAVPDHELCSSSVAATVNAPVRGYWTITNQTNLLDVLCIGDAENYDFWTAPPKPKPRPVETCVDDHKWDETTSRCEWTGPSDACVKVFNFENHSEYVIIPIYPTNGIPGVNAVFNQVKTLNSFEDKVTRAVVRRGCMATFWPHRLYSETNKYDIIELKILRNVEYGEYSIQNYDEGTVESMITSNLSPSAAGLSHVSCYCDPFETERLKPAKIPCVQHHEWNEEQKKCVWTLEDKFAAEIYNFQGMKFLLEIPNWPVSKRADLNFHLAKMPDYEFKVTRIIVRQGCFCTMYSGNHLTRGQQGRPLMVANYGDHEVASKYSKKIPKDNYEKLAQTGALRVVCECMKGDSGKDRILRTPPPPKCIEMHAYNNESRRCEWMGPSNGCMLITNTRNEKKIVNISNWPASVSETHVLDESWKNQLTWMTVRRGCEGMINADPTGNYTYFLIDSSNLLYGTYRVPQQSFGDVQGGLPSMGAKRLTCICDPTLIYPTSVNPKTPCLDGHAYEKQTGQCEWTRNKRIVAEIRNDVGQRMEIEIPNWPTEKYYSWNLKFAKGMKNSAMFLNRLSGIFVRQHCFVTLCSGDYFTSKRTLLTVGYGNYTVPKGTVRLVVRCLQ